MVPPHSAIKICGVEDITESILSLCCIVGTAECVVDIANKTLYAAVSHSGINLNRVNIFPVISKSNIAANLKPLANITGDFGKGHLGGKPFGTKFFVPLSWHFSRRMNLF